MAGQLEISLSAKEFDLLYFLASNPNQVFTKSQLLDHVWGYSAYVEDNTITVYIRRLREKLERTEIKSSYIKTVWGVGYKFNPDETE
ncbi:MULTISPECIES: winged helix-turn-helix domain-containing protein [Paenibacillus]|nr:helix-turn-helix domain-containing protein [Paenibacillus lautus]